MVGQRQQIPAGDGGQPGVSSTQYPNKLDQAYENPRGSAPGTFRKDVADVQDDNQINQANEQYVRLRNNARREGDLAHQYVITRPTRFFTHQPSSHVEAAVRPRAEGGPAVYEE